MPPPQTACLHREEQPPRRCQAPGCRTWLSSRNPTERCWVHKGWRELTSTRTNNQQLADILLETATAMA